MIAGVVCWKRVTNASQPRSSSVSTRCSEAGRPASRIASRSASTTSPDHGSVYVRYTGSDARVRSSPPTSRGASRRSRSASGANGPRTCSSLASNATSPNGRSSPEIATQRSVSGASPARSTNSAATSLRNS